MNPTKDAQKKQRVNNASRMSKNRSINGKGSKKKPVKYLGSKLEYNHASECSSAQKRKKTWHKT
jgi:hypothetical protein